MAVQLIIDGAHITDVIAEVHALAEATGKQTVPVKNEVGAKSGASGSTTSAPSKPAETSTDDPATGGKTDTKKNLTREEQDAAVEAMVEQGFKDPRFNQLTKGRQTDVEKRLKEKDAAEEQAGDDLGSMFDDDDAPAEVEVTADTIRDLMGKLGKDEDGEPVQENLLKIRDILTKFVPKGEEIKVGKIPADKLPAVYAEMKKLEA